MTSPQDDPQGFDNATAPQVSSLCPSLDSSSASSYESVIIGAVDLLPKDSLQSSITIDVYCDMEPLGATTPTLEPHLKTNEDPNFDRDNPTPAGTYNVQSLVPSVR